MTIQVNEKMRAFDHRVRRLFLRGWLVLAVQVGGLFLLFSGWCAAAENQQAPLRVLFLYDEGRDLRGLGLVKEGFETTFLAGTERPVEFFQEYLDASRFQEVGHHILFADYLRTKYGEVGLDLIVPIIHTRTDWASRIPRELFPDVPIVFASSPARNAEPIPSVSQMTGVRFSIDVVKGLEAAIAVRPAARRVIVVAGADGLHSESIAQLVVAARSHPEIAFEYWTDRTAPQMLSAAASLPRNSLVLYLELYRDSEGASFLPWQFGQLLAKAAPVPVFGIWESYLDTGIIGGAVVDLTSLGARTAMQALRVINGERASALPVNDAPSAVLMFDWRAMQRRGISMADLPAGSVVRFRPPPLWEAYRPLFVAGLIWIIVLSIALLSLVLQRVRRRRVEKDLRQSERQLRLIANSLPALIAYVDSAQRYIWVNEAYKTWWKDQYGVTSGEQLRDVMGEEGYAEIRSQVDTVLAGESVTFETVVRHPTLGPRDLLVYYVPDIVEEGVRGFFALISDTTALRHAERQAERDRLALAHLSRVSTAAELATSVAHQLNQPLGAILHNAQAGQRFLGLKNPDLNEIEEIFADIVADDIRAREIMRRLRTFLRRDPPEIETLNINDMIGDVLKLLQSELIIQGVSVRTDLTADLPCAQGDRIQLQQALTNLVMNAEQAMSGSGASPRTLFINTAKDLEAGVVVYLQDTGPGLDEEMLEGIFEPFETTKADGMGMGLAISRSIVEAHGGKLWAENASGGGARLCMTLPAGG